MTYFDAVIYTPLREEFESLQQRFAPLSDVNGVNYTGYISKTPKTSSVLVVVGFEWGNDHSFSIMNEVLSAYDCGIAVCVGIGGAISKDAKLGDVYYSKDVLDLTQRLKLEKDKSGKSRIMYDPETYPSSELITKVLDRSRLSATGPSPYKDWIKACTLVNEGKLVGHDAKILGFLKSHFYSPVADNGKIAATNMVLADSLAVEDVKACGRKMACVDTESAGFAKACKDIRKTPHIVIRGMSDKADETKKITEDKFKNIFRDIAASNAALFLYHHIDDMITAGRKLETKSVNSKTDSDAYMLSSIDKNEAYIKEQLMKRSIVFKTLNHDYKVPVPRLRKIEPPTKKVKDKSAEQEIEEILCSEDRIQVNLPKHYPDTALPWLFSHLLTEANLFEKYTIRCA